MPVILPVDGIRIFKGKGGRKATLNLKGAACCIVAVRP